MPDGKGVHSEVCGLREAMGVRQDLEKSSTGSSGPGIGEAIERQDKRALSQWQGTQSVADH